MCVLQGLNILYIYCLALWCFHILWSPNSVLYISITLHSADLILNCAKHWLFTSKCLLSVSRAIFFYSIIRNLFLSAQNIVFSRASATFVLPIPFFPVLFPNSQLIPKWKNIVFSQVHAACVSRPIFSYSLIRNWFQSGKNILFSHVDAACLSRPIFSYSLIQDYLVWSGPANGLYHLWRAAFFFN